MTALLLIDIQNDFLPGGALAVPQGDEILPVVARLMPHFPLVVATQDWHPADHGSFAANHPGRQPGETVALTGLDQILWPVHCVQGTPGAELASPLDHAPLAHVARKGTDATVDSYSAFFDNARRRATGLENWLRERGVNRLVVAGLATDYCVQFSVLDALALGFDVLLVVDACRGVNLNPGDCDRALAAMQAAGARLVAAEELVPAPLDPLAERLRERGANVVCGKSGALRSADLSPLGPAADDPLVRELAGCDRLAKLNLSGTAITDAGLTALATLPRLEELDLRRTTISDAGLAALVGCKRLRLLLVAETAITREAVRALRGQLINTRVVT